jgi:endonuclease YncB( thermonuclease family)
MQVNLTALNTHPQYLLITNIRAVDGDTIVATVTLPLETWIQRRIRLKAFYAPEMKGRDALAGERARQRLQDAVTGHGCHIQCRGMRNDRYGRLTAVLLIDGRVVHPGQVLGEFALTAEQHKADLDHARAGGSGGSLL